MLMDRIADQLKILAFEQIATAPERAVCQFHLPSGLRPDETRALPTSLTIDDSLRQV
jgi:hypothetical protein